jgi:hypothetical protein
LTAPRYQWNGFAFLAITTQKYRAVASIGLWRATFYLNQLRIDLATNTPPVVIEVQ